ncbi:hypothetical protein OG799_25600 [Micromonospora sp. NBC_00898]|uniref:hypothetical protein n=1 Tax=Micromonospora sp. NBC_00898 TaxID=2975981 RepID=UPI00386D3444|nr:hypothetical protein OG799_25600 [Micromonospora sp. NBC_00898]
MKTRFPITSMSVISPLVILGVSVRGVLGTSRVCAGTGSDATVTVLAATRVASLPTALMTVVPAVGLVTVLASLPATVSAAAGRPSNTTAPATRPATARLRTCIETTPCNA